MVPLGTANTLRYSPWIGWATWSTWSPSGEANGKPSCWRWADRQLRTNIVSLYGEITPALSPSLRSVSAPPCLASGWSVRNHLWSASLVCGCGWGHHFAPPAKWSLSITAFGLIGSEGPSSWSGPGVRWTRKRDCVTRYSSWIARKLSLCINVP